VPPQRQGPLVSLHGWPPGSRGDVGFRRLIDRLRDSGVEVVSIDGPLELPTTMTAWVQHFDRELTAREADLGPSPALLGYCMSAAVALELTKTRPEVPYVGLIDMWWSRPRFGRGDFGRYRMSRRRMVEDLLVQRYADPSATWKKVALTNVREFKHFRHLRRHEPAKIADLDEPATLAIYRAALPHRPSVCRVPVHLYPTVRSIATRTEGDTTLGWARFLQGGYRATVVPGNHESCFDSENVGHMTAAIVSDLGI
jgi:pimeloyl-ACP methyl ester carboxylesterase